MSGNRFHNQQGNHPYSYDPEYLNRPAQNQAVSQGHGSQRFNPTYSNDPPGGGHNPPYDIDPTGHYSQITQSSGNFQQYHHPHSASNYGHYNPQLAHTQAPNTGTYGSTLSVPSQYYFNAETFEMRSHPWENMRSFDVATFQQSFQGLVNYIDRNEFREVPVLDDAVSFSKMTTDDLGRIGVTKVTPNISCDECLTRLRRFLRHVTVQGITPMVYYQTALDDFFDARIANLKVTLHDIGKSAAKRPEARSRMVTDQIILLLIRFFRLYKKSPMLYPEYRISSAQNPVIIDYGRYRTYLTGVVDYALVDIRDTNQREKWENETSDSSQLAHNRTVSTSMDDYISDPTADPRPGLLFYEAKSVTEAGILANHIPQVAGESIAVMRAKKFKQVPWCLTTGTTWIFGHTAEDNGTFELSYTAPFHVTPHNVKDLLIFNAFWSMFTVTEIYKVLKNYI
ncbi:hypothetical protein BDN70DRAFT_993532 [Pholiota conissans]|uniref:Uncharacterized protein n=1 Tax=Pholiota conissans TaxID=109636 RepID=A0A9P5Z1B2_9AGAR|nr:hypothetical protein BDN70DRAFT_993532 [Pholiota conissans]